MVTTKVTRIGKRWHARLLMEDGTVFDEMACDHKEDIGFICYTMLRWYDKLGGCDPMADASRNRVTRKQQREPVGKIWYKGELENEARKRD